MSDRQERIPMQPGEYLFYTVNPDEIREKIRCSDFGFPEEWTAQEEQKEIRICVDKLLSDQGATCMVYEGTLSENGRKVIVKEFYPCSRRNVWAIGRSQDREQKLRIPRMTRVQNQEFAQRCRQFLRSYLWQKKFYSEAQFLEIVVEPQALAVYGDTCYIVSDYHNGVSMVEQAGKFRTLKEKIFLCQYLADVLSILEENGYLFLDLCEENFLMILQTKSRYQLRMFDMDSIIDLNDLDNLHQAEGNIFIIRSMRPARFFRWKKVFSETALMISKRIIWRKALRFTVWAYCFSRSCWDTFLPGRSGRVWKLPAVRKQRRLWRIPSGSGRRWPGS